MGKTGRKIGVQPRRRRRRRRWRLRRRCDGWLLLVAVAVVVVAVAVVAAVLTGVADFLDSFSEVGGGGLPTIRGSSAFVLVDSPRCRFWRGRNRNRNAHSCSCVGRKEAAGGTTTTTITTTTTTTRARSTGNVSEEFESDPDDVDDDEHDTTTTTTTTTAGGSPNLGVRAGTRCFCFSFSRREVLQKTSSGCVAAIEIAMAMAVATSAATATVPEECKAMVPVLARGGLLSDSGAFSPSSSPLTLPPLLESSALYQVCTASTPTSTSKFRSRSGSPPRGGPSVGRVLPTELLRDLASHRAVVLGEHHPSRADHLLQAALVEGLFRNANANANNAEKNNTNNANKPMAVGLEAVQQAFQPALDAYSAGSIGEDELFRATEWDARWYWSFDAYLPLLRTCKGLGIPLLALGASSEDRALLEERGSGGWEALGEKDDENENNDDTAKLLLRYIPDWEGARRFGSTAAYAEYVRYTLRPIYELQQTTRTKKRRDGGNDTAEEGPPRNKPPTPTLSDFVAKQAFRDEAMASAAARWSIDHPDGLLVACVGANHASFRCGVPGRLERLLLLPGSWLSSASVSASPLPVGASPPSSMAMARRRKVCSVLLNPEPLNTGTPLEACRADGTLAPEDDDEYDARRRSRSVFVSNRANQVCIETSAGELQNYALQFEFVSSSSSPSSTGGERRALQLQLQLEAIAQGQVRSGETVLALADYLIVSPRETTTTITPA